MEQSLGQNNFLESTPLGSKYFDPFYIFNQGIDRFYEGFFFVAENLYKVINVLQFVAFLFSLFFLSVIIYAIIRLFEIRKKERAHLRHEIAEYAHKHPELV